MTRERVLQSRKTYSELSDYDRAVIDIVRAADKPLPRLALARGFSGSCISRLIDQGHLAETPSGEIIPTPLTVREMVDQRIVQGWQAGKGYCHIAALAETTPGTAFDRIQDMGLDSRRRRRGGFQIPVEGHKVRRLRWMLIDAERRGLDTSDDGRDLEHRALYRRFKEARNLVRQFPKRAPDKWSNGAVVELRQLRDVGKSVARIAKHLGRPPEHVAQRIVLEGRSTWVRWQDWEEKEVYDGLRTGLSFAAIAARLPGRSEGAVRHRAKRLLRVTRSNLKWTDYADTILTNALVNGLPWKKRAALFPQ